MQTRFYRRWEDDALKRCLNLIKRGGNTKKVFYLAVIDEQMFLHLCATVEREKATVANGRTGAVEPDMLVGLPVGDLSRVTARDRPERP